MDDEKKYEVQGVATIGTDEYRDLIESSIKNEAEANDYRSRLWREESKTRNLQEELDKMSQYKDKLMTFIKQDNERYQAYVRFTAEQSVEAE